MSRSNVALFALGAAAAVAWGLAGWRAAHPSLSTPLAGALARVVGVPRETVSVGPTRLAWPARLVIQRVVVREWSVEELAIDFDPLAALRGHLRPTGWQARALAGPAGRVDRAEATVARGRMRVRLRGVALARPGLGDLRLGEVGLELERGRLERLAFSDGAALGIGQLAGAAVRAPHGAWLLRAARPGLRITAHLDPSGVHGRAQLDRLPLAGLPFPRALELSAAEASGTIRFAGGGGQLRATPQLTLTGLVFHHRTLSRQRLTPAAISLFGQLELDRTDLTVRDLQLGLGQATLLLDGRLRRRDHLELTVTLPTVGCAALLAALPRPLVPHLDGLVLSGEIGGQAQLRADRGHLDELAFSLDGEVGCRARSDAPLADVAALRQPDARALAGHRVDGRAFPLTAQNPAWRSLDSLPASVVRPFLLAEDGRFFLHRGFDLPRIGRALAVDLHEGRVDRGASTITQQVAKNLWLSGERTLGRKLEEAVLAWRLEQVLDKRRILELYLNLVELGPGTYGLSQASERYFGKPPEALSVDEAAQLAALLPAPRRGMDEAWQRRYNALAARLLRERVPMPIARTGIKFSRR